MEEQKTTMFAFIKGLILGAAAGLLFAPKSGKETRDAIGAKAQEVKQKAQSASSTVKDKVHHGVDVAKEKGSRAVDAMKNANIQE
jgi:gas vesicle protein